MARLAFVIGIAICGCAPARPELAATQKSSDEITLVAASPRAMHGAMMPIGHADGVAGQRERRGWWRDPDRHRLSEELLITIDNHRARPVDVVIREHLDRGQNWTLAYQSAPAVKDGPQQISLRARVPANGQTKVLYVVVYTW